MKLRASLALTVLVSSPLTITCYSIQQRHPVSRPLIEKLTLPSRESFLFQRNARVSDISRVHNDDSTLQSSITVQLHRRRVSAITLSLFAAFSLSIQHAVACSVLSLSKPKHPVKALVRVVFLWLGFLAALQQIRVKRRQRLDATSEWGRYATYPSARGRAVMSLCFKLTPLWFLEQIWRTPASRTGLRTCNGNMFADGLLQLGPLYIKLGQIVSCREKLLPEEWKRAMEKLQDRVPARTGQAALDLAYSSIGSQEEFDAIFSNFTTTPLAAASLGQVHKAVLRETNDTVAVKIQRPYLRRIYDQDFSLLMWIATTADRFLGSRAQVGGVQQSWVDIFTDAKTILYREIDYRDEADNAIRFAQDFGLGLNGTAMPALACTRRNETLPSAAPWLRTPFVYANLSSEKVLVMEYVPSIKITNTAKLDEAKITADEKEYLADSLARSYLRQFCVNKFFSTDPHPGNLGVERAGGRPRLVFYDFGQACSLTSDQADGILEVIEAIVDSDASRCVEAFEKMGVLTDDADLDEVQAKCQDNFDKGLVKVRKKKLRKAGYRFKDATNMTATNSTVTNATGDDVMKYFKLPAEYAFVARAISQMDGVGKSLDPDFDFISSAAPNIVEIKGATEYLKDEYVKWVRGIVKRLRDCWNNLFKQ